jgi:UDP-glucose 4-epimerase
MSETVLQRIHDGLNTGSRVLVTGANGFVGWHLLRALNAAGVRPVALHLPGEQPRADTDAEWVSCDLTHAGTAESLMRDLTPQYVFHLAAKLSAERSWEFAAESTEMNFCVTNRLMIALGSHAPELRRMLLIGSAEEYGNSPSLPVREDCPVHPVSPYSAAKAAASRFAQLYAELFRFPVCILRPFILYGPGQSGSMMIPQLILSALRGEDFPMTKGEQTRDFVYVGDAVECMLLAAITPRVDGEVFNICSGVEHSIRHVADLIMRIIQPEMELLPGALPYRQNEVWRIVGSYEKAQRLLGWSPSTDMERGLHSTIEWYRYNNTAHS